jgi:outer membrane lipoprotein SlyB
MNFKLLASVIIITGALAGCAATQTAISQRNLDVQTKMSDTIFLDPVGEKNKTIFVQVRNSTDKTEFDIGPAVKAAIAAKGYRQVSDPDSAYFIMQANVLSVEKSSKSPMSSPFGSYGAALGGAAIGGLASAATGGSNRNIAGTALIAGAFSGLAEAIGNGLVSDVYYSAITDVQIKQRNKIGVVSQADSRQNLKNGSGGGTSVATNEKIDYKIYQTRILSVANQVNLEFTDAAPLLNSGLTKVLSGVFE